MQWPTPRYRRAMPPPATLPPAGWYRDPGGAAGMVRWWDGQRWGAYLRPRNRVPGGDSWPGDPAGQGEQGAGAAYPGVSPPGVSPPGVYGGGAFPGGPAPGVHPPGHPAPPAPPTTQPRLPLQALWWAAVGFVAGELAGGLLAAVAATALGVSAANITTSAPILLIGEVGLWAGMIGACLVVSRRYGTGSFRRDLTFGFRPVDVVYGILAAIGALIVDAVVSGAFLHTRFHGTNTQLITGQKAGSAGLVVVTLIVAVGAPFFEELFFRGVVRLALASRMRPALAVVGQAVLFGLAHYQSGAGWGNVSVIIGISGIGLVLGITAQRSGRLGAGMIGHGLFNLTVALLVIG